jgi:hypothetical protein
MRQRWKRQRWRDASEAAACIGGIRMHWKSMEADGADGADGAGGEYTVSEAVKAVRTLSELVRTEWYLSGVTSAACRT